MTGQADCAAALDLLAACLVAGATPQRAVETVGGVFDGDVGEVLRTTGRLLDLGAPVETAWARSAQTPGWEPVARAAIRAHHSGSSLADAFERLAQERRREARVQAATASARAGVRIVLPLGGCFLPAFVLIGVVPVVAGMAGLLWFGG
jgi:pilus assembly protein TadC